MATSNPQWHFNDGTKWVPYDSYSSDVIEKAHESGENTVYVSTRPHSYSIDLVRMKQTNTRTRTERDIKRTGTGTNILPLRTPSSVPYAAQKRPCSDPKIDPLSVVSVPSKSGTLCHAPFFSGPMSSPTSLYTRPMSGPPKSGTVPLSSGTPQQAMPRKKYKHEPNKFPRVLGSYDTFFHKYTEIISEKKIPKDETCPICLTSLLEPADVEVPKASRSSILPLDVVCGLKKCSHMFHLACIGTMLDSTPNVKLSEISISCPICQTIHGVRTGDQPLTGTMNFAFDNSSVPGYERFGTIRVTYNFNNGTNENGVSYNAAGFPRVCYIPKCPEGELVLKLLQLGWQRRLIFTVGTSVTTGRPNCVVWNNIHHKTEPHSNTSGHGFPDPNFLKNIKMELAVQGVTEEELK